MSAPRTVVRSAHAKINVFLRVTGVRSDGYHEIESLVLPISLADTVTVSPADSLDVVMGGERAADVGAEPGALNLALVAALALGARCAGGGARIEIDKHIPVAAGLGGGSADAAATLLALDELWACGLGADALAEVGERVGSDVPALLLGSPALVGGRGERVRPVAVAPTWWVLLGGGAGVRSPDAYRWWDEDGGVVGPDPAAVIAAATAGDVAGLAAAMFNDLEGPVTRRHPGVAAALDGLRAAGAIGVLMSGSGSSVLGLARDEAHAREVAGRVEGSVVVSAPPERG